MAAVQSPKKICVVCGKDVSDSPRVKDAQGRYVCQGACQATFAGKAKAPAAPAPKVESSFMDQLISTSPMISTTSCPTCNAPLPRDGVLCTRCGFNIQTGKAVKTKLIVEKEKRSAGGADSSDGPKFEVLLAVSALVCVGIAAIGLMSPEMFVLSFGVISAVGFGAWIWGIVVAFTTDERKWGIYGICAIIPCVGAILGLMFTYYMLVLCSNKWARAVYSGIVLGSIACTLIARFNFDRWPYEIVAEVLLPKP